MVSHVAWETCGLAWLVLAFFAAGAFVERWVGAPSEDRAWRGLRRMALGMAAWIAFVFLLGATQLLYAPLLWAAMTFAVSAYLLFYRHEWWAFTREFGVRIRLTPAVAVIAFSLGIVLMFLFVTAMGPRVTADSHNYHLFLPKHFLKHHGFYRLPYKPISTWPLNGEMLYMLAMVVKDYMLAHLVNFLAGALTVVGAWAFARRAGGAFAAWIAAALFLVNDLVRWVFPVCYPDLLTTLFFFLAFWSTHCALNDPENEKRHLLTAGILAGAMAGCKLNAFEGVMVLGAVYVAASWRRGIGRALWRMMLWFALPSAAMLAPWLIKSAVLTGNPVYPFMFDVFGGPEWSANLSADLLKSHMDMGMGRAPLDYLMLPFRVIWDGAFDFPHFYGRIDRLWVVLLPLTAFAGAGLPLVQRAFVASALFFVGWALGSQQMRYLLPILPLLSVAVAVTAAHWLRKIPWPRVARAVKAVLLVAAAGYLLAAVEADPDSHGSQAAGRRFLARGALEHPLEEFINHELPADAVILNPQAQIGFFFDREMVAHNLLNTPQIEKVLLTASTPKRMNRRLKDNGIGFILLGRQRRTDRFAPAFETMLTRPDLARLVFENPRYQLYELR